LPGIVNVNQDLTLLDFFTGNPSLYARDSNCPTSLLGAKIPPVAQEKKVVLNHLEVKI